MKPTNEQIERVARRIFLMRLEGGIASVANPPPRLGRILGNRLVIRIARAAAKEALLEEGEQSDQGED